MEIRKRIIHLLGGKTPDEVGRAANASYRCGYSVACYEILEKFERHDEVRADDMRDYIKIFIQLKLRELRNGK